MLLPVFSTKQGLGRKGQISAREESLVQEEDEDDEEGRLSHQRAGRAKHSVEAEQKKKHKV